jgi:hypothetical protein
MNPNTAKTPTDRAKYRANYMANLALEASNNQKNLNANQIFRATGQTPSQPTDTRTTTEKYADTERLKIELRAGLATLTDGINASLIVESLSPQEVRFATTQFPFIVQDLKPKWALGIPAGVFVAYLRRLLEKFRVTEGVELGLQQETGNQILLSFRQYLDQMVQSADLDEVESVVSSLSSSSSSAYRETARTEAFNLLDSIDEDIRILRSVLPTDQDRQNVEAQPPSVQADLYTLFNSAFAELPTRQQVREDLQNLQRAIQDSNTRAINSALSSIRSDLTLDAGSVSSLKEAKQTIQRGSFGLSQAQLEAQIASLRQRSGESRASRASSGEVLAGGAREEPYYSQEEKELGEGRTTTETLATQASAVALPKMTLTGIIQTIQGTPGLKKLVEEKLVNTESGERIDFTKLSKTGTRGGKTPIEQSNLNEIFQEFYGRAPSIGRGLPKMKGKGLNKVIRKMDNKSIAHNLVAPIVKPKMYHPFGSVAINKHRLLDNVLMLKRPCGSGINSIPTQRIGNGLVKVLRNMTEGKNPEYEDINTLKEVDRDLLHTIMKHSHQLDKFAVPKPQTKSKDEAEMDRFNILKGEMIAGNDNRHLVREFKVLLMKMLHRGVVPRRQANEILIDITAMGL